MEILAYLALLMVVSLPFAAVGSHLGNVISLAIPIAFWALVFALVNQGVLPGPGMNLGQVLFAALVGVGFAMGGNDMRRRGAARQGG